MPKRRVWGVETENADFATFSDLELLHSLRAGWLLFLESSRQLSPDTSVAGAAAGAS